MNKEQTISLWTGTVIFGIAVYNNLPLKVLLLIGVAIFILFYTLGHTTLIKKQKYALIITVLFILFLFATRIIEIYEKSRGGLGG